MANPTYTLQGITPIHPLNVTTGFAVTNGIVTLDHGGLALNANAIDPATAEFNFPLPNAPVNGANVLFILKIFNSTNQFIREGIIRFFDSVGRKTEISPLNSWRRGELFYRIHIPSFSGFTADVDFDITDLVSIELSIRISDIDETDVYVVRRLDYYDLSPVVLTGGSLGDPFTLDTILSTLNNDFWEYDHSTNPNWLKTYPRQAGPLLEPDVGLQIGDGTAGATYFELGTLQGWSLLNELQNRAPYSGVTATNDYAEVLGTLPAAGRRLRFNLGDTQSFPPAIVFSCEFADISSVAITYNSWLFLKTQPSFGLLSIINSCSFIDSEASISGGLSYIDCTVVNSSATIAIAWNGSATFTNCRIDCPLSNYGINFDGANFVDGATFDASTLTFVTEPSVKKFRLNAPGKTLNLSVGTTGFTTADVDVVAGTVVIQAPQVTLQLVGIPAVVNAIVYVKNLSTDQVTFPSVVGGEATIPVDTATQYQIRADAPGYLASPFFTVPGTVSRFEFSLENQRALYDSGVNKSAQIDFNYSTYEVTISDTADLTFADFFRTLEDYLATQQGMLLEGHPRPVTVSLGNGVRNYLFFPPNSGQVNPVRIKPNPLNTTDPTFTNFVIILQEALAPLFDIFDFSSAGGRIVRFQTDSVVANVSEGSGSGASAADIYSYFTSGSRPDVFKATGFSTHSPADVWTVTSRTLTAVDKTGYSLSAAERATLATQIEAALINEGDGQQLIDAILQVINNDLDLPALELTAIANQVRTELATELARLDVAVSSVMGLNESEIRSAIGLALPNLDAQLTAQLLSINNRPTLAEMEASTPLTTIADLSGVNSSLATIQTALAGVAVDAKAAKNFSAAGL